MLRNNCFLEPYIDMALCMRVWWSVSLFVYDVHLEIIIYLEMYICMRVCVYVKAGCSKVVCNRLCVS